MRSFVRFATLLSSFAIVFAFGCRGGDDDGGGSDGGRNDGNQGGMTIQQIQTPPGPGVGSPVELHGVVVTAVDRFGGRQGGFYVEEPGGGPYSGVFVFTGNTSAVAGLEPGDEVSITGAVVDEFALMTDTSGRKLTEVADPTGGMMTITETGTAALPAPMVIDPRTLVDDDTEQSEAEKWESVLIQLANVAVTGAPRPVSMTDPTLKEMRITGPFRVGSSLVDLPDTIAVDTCYASMTGVVDYFFDYRLLPRSAADLVGGGSGCPAPEAGETTCMDTMDNDADGFVDCQDRSCQVLPMCVLDATIPDVQMQMGSFTVGTRVRLSNVTVTAVASSLFWVQSSNNPYSGVAVFPMTAPTTLAVGDRVDVEATIDEYFDVTELTDATFTENGTASPPAPVEMSFSTFNTDASAEMYEGMLVRVSDVTVLAIQDANGQWTVGNSTTPAAMGLLVDDIMADPTGATMGACFSHVQGPLHFSFEEWKIEPRNAGDMMLGAGCP